MNFLAAILDFEVKEVTKVIGSLLEVFFKTVTSINFKLGTKHLHGGRQNPLSNSGNGCQGHKSEW